MKAPVNTNIGIEKDCELCEFKLYREDERFFINITVEIGFEDVQEYDGVLGIDLGLRNPVVPVALPSQRSFLRGQEIKHIQSKYFYLRRQSETGKRWHRREQDRVRDRLYKITPEMANYAKENRLVVAVIDLSGIQEQDEGRKMNRKLHRFPHYSFRRMLEYKCGERGIKYIKISETYTSQICPRCGEKGERKGGLFKCPKCGSEINSDVNAARNIAGRALGKPKIRPLVRAGAPVVLPRTLSREATFGASSEAISR